MWVKPGSAVDALSWDRWRSCWVVACRAPASGGKANRAVVELLMGWLERSSGQIRWVVAGSSRSKILEVSGMGDAEVERRLSARLAEGKDRPRTEVTDPT